MLKKDAVSGPRLVFKLSSKQSVSFLALNNLQLVVTGALPRIDQESGPKTYQGRDYETQSSQV
jgi:hypothetical protein